MRAVAPTSGAGGRTGALNLGAAGPPPYVTPSSGSAAHKRFVIATRRCLVRRSALNLSAPANLLARHGTRI